MIFKFCVANFKKINLKGINSFCKKYNSNVKLSVKMDSKGIGIKMYDEDRKSSICAYGVEKIEKNTDIPVNENNIIESTLDKCDYLFYIDAKNGDELRLVYLLAMYFASSDKMLLFNMGAKQMLTYKMLRDFDLNKVEKLVAQYEVSAKYSDDRFKWVKQVEESFQTPLLFWVLLVSSSVIAAIILTLMVVVYDIENGLILGSPFIVIGLFVIGWVVWNLISYKKGVKELKKINFEYQYDMAKLNDDRTPKKPSGKQKNLKRIVINILGIMILPALALGSFLMIIGYIMEGILVLVLPWILLMLIKKFITDVKEGRLEENFFSWLDNCADIKVPNGVKAISVEVHDLGNYEWEVEMIGCLDFEFGTTKWTKDNICSMGKRFKFKHVASWEEIEILLSDNLGKYLNTNRKAEFYSKFDGIAFGFKDGIIIAVYGKEVVEE